MITHLLDTNVCIELIRGRSSSVRRRFSDELSAHARIAVSSISVFELWYGVAKSLRSTENAARLEAFLAGPLECVDFGEEDGMAAGRIRARLERAGSPIGAYDTLIAGQAIRLKATLVTANVSEFKRIAELQVDDWTETIGPR